MHSNKIRNRLITLDDALDYDNPDVIEKFLENFEFSRKEALEIFEETKKWLWLCANQVSDVDLVIDIPMLVIDEMWHTFILFTREYSEFCMAKFGHYIHHSPTTVREKERDKAKYLANPEGANKEQEEKLRKLIGYIYDFLGEDTAYRWYWDFAEKYTPINLENRRRKHA